MIKNKYLKYLAAITLIASPSISLSESLSTKIKTAAAEAFLDWQHLISDLDLKCVEFEFDEPKNLNGDKRIDVDLLEIHNEQCGGDPQTAPRIGSLKIEFNASDEIKNVYIYDVVTGTYFLVDALR